MGGHYERDMYRQIEELTDKVERLESENRELRRENRQLRDKNVKHAKQIQALEATMEARIQQAVDEAVAKATAPLKETIAKQADEIQRLKAQLKKDSSNSSKPSSRNGFKKVPNNRERSNRKQGGQHGHLWNPPLVFLFLPKAAASSNIFQSTEGNSGRYRPPTPIARYRGPLAKRSLPSDRERYLARRRLPCSL